MKILKITLVAMFIGLISFNVSILSKNNSVQGLDISNLSASAQPGVEFEQGYDCWDIIPGIFCPRECYWCGYMPFTIGINLRMCHH